MTATVADKARVRQINQNVKLFGAFELAFEELREATTKDVNKGREKEWERSAGKTLTAEASVGKQCFKVEMTKHAGDWLKAKERSFSIRRDGRDHVSYELCQLRLE